MWADFQITRFRRECEQSLTSRVLRRNPMLDFNNFDKIKGGGDVIKTNLLSDCISVEQLRSPILTPV